MSSRYFVPSKGSHQRAELRDQRPELDELIDEGDRVVMVVREFARGKGSGSRWSKRPSGSTRCEAARLSTRPSTPPRDRARAGVPSSRPSRAALGVGYVGQLEVLAIRSLTRSTYGMKRSKAASNSTSA